MSKKLHCVIVFYNYCEYKIRYKVTKEFIERYKNHPNMDIYIVELAYKNQEYCITDKNNKNHLQLRTEEPLWHKENLINIGINKLLPKDWEYVAWIDCNLKFENNDFVEKTIEKLQKYDVVQMFKIVKYEKFIKYSYFYYMGHNNEKKFKSIKEKLMMKKNGYNPGIAYACTKKAYNIMEKIYDCAIVGGGDNIFANALNGENIIIKIFYKYYCKNKNIIEYINKYIDKVKNLKSTYVDNVIIYINHGNLKKRQYDTRDVILSDFNPENDIIYKDGIIQLNKRDDIQEKINKMFFDRDEDK